jgi:DNA-binding MarR family transcriptional regulator/GNAT superfamily N-acetyltransferase
MAPPPAAETIETVRAFNRFYTRAIGVIPEGHLASPYSLADVRVLYELAHREASTAAEIAGDLKLDAGYMSRIVKRLEDGGLLARSRSDRDARQALLELTPAGRTTFAGLNDQARSDVATLLRPLSAAAQRELAAALRKVETLLGDPPEAAEPGAVTLRPPAPGDLGWVVERHGALYAREYGWDWEFEALAAKIVAEFVERLDPERERCWIAEHAGERVGSIFLVQKSAEVAKLRLFLVEPTARGLGIGGRLVAECERFARQAGYRVLWTQSVLEGARRIYTRAGYAKVHEEGHRSFGHDLVAETWELELG